MCSIVSYAFFVLFFIYNTNSSSNIAIKLTPNSSVSTPAEYEHHQKKKMNKMSFTQTNHFLDMFYLLKRPPAIPLYSDKKKKQYNFLQLHHSLTFIHVNRSTDIKDGFMNTKKFT